MRRAAAVLVAAAALGVAIAAAVGGGGDHPASLTLVERGRELGPAVQVVAAPGGSPLVVRQDGVLQALAGPRVLLDLRGRIAYGGEQGLLGVAFHPEWPHDARAFVHASAPDGDTQVLEYRRGPDGALREQRLLLEVDQRPYPNHKGGNLVFGLDGQLYLGLGDGGGAFDPHDRSQNPAKRFGKLLRLDVDRPGAVWGLVALGLRNPWRVTLDRATGDLWIGDVGQDLSEEVDRLPAGAPFPIDFGWPRHEGDRVHPDRVTSGAAAYRPPESTYGRALGCSIVGGPVVRGASRPLNGRYLYGDLCTGRIWSFPVDDDGKSGPSRAEDLAVPGLVSIDALSDGRLFLTSFYGFVYEVVARR